MITPRPTQENILHYKGGRMGISAVPGSGKTFTLSLLASKLIAQGVLNDDQEILIVTLVNSAVDNFYSRIGIIITDQNIIPNLGFRVRTLHGFAHDILRERPELAGLDTQFQIIDEREAQNIIDDCVSDWMRKNPDYLDEYLNYEIDKSRIAYVKREKLSDDLRGLAGNCIRYAKDHLLTPELIQNQLNKLSINLALANFCAQIYSAYQRALAYRGAVDFDDLIRYALVILRGDVDFLSRLQYRWPYILEDEAQDSSQVQEQILSLLAGENGNWIRVGDSNQAIYETFTTANPIYLRNFINDHRTQSFTLPTSSRSTLSIIRLANYLVDWTMIAHPIAAIRNALQAPPYICPVENGGKDINPPDNPNGIQIITKKFSAQEEIIAVADSLERWLPNNQDKTVAVLTPRNQRAFVLADELRRRKIEFVDGLLQSSSSTRLSSGALANILRYLSDPQSPEKLSTAFRVWRRQDRSNEIEGIKVEITAELLLKCVHVEDYIYPSRNGDWLNTLEASSEYPDLYDDLKRFRLLIRRWLTAVLLPIDQLVITLAQDIFSQPAELALAYKLALLLKRASLDHPDWRLPHLTDELAVIARNERRFLGFSSDDTGFDASRYKGKPVISTMHKAKGLEWDRVYLMSVNNYDFPSASDYDTYISEKWYYRDKLNLEAEALAQIDSMFLENMFGKGKYEGYQEGIATKSARLDYVRERLRLLYVGITRAKSELIISWNSGRRGEAKPAIPLKALSEFSKKVS